MKNSVFSIDGLLKASLKEIPKKLVGNYMNSAQNQVSVWDNVLSLIEKNINADIFESWFRSTKFELCDPNSKKISVRASSVTANWVDSYYKQLVQSSLKALDHDGYQIEWVIDDSTVENNGAKNDPDFFFKTAKNTFSENVNSPAFLSQARVNEVEPIESSLNQKYTFQTFVVGSCNQFAHAASLGAAEMPGTTYNPLFLYGGVGLGKTHLMHAIGHAIKQKNPSRRVAYITSEKFMNELINAIRYDRTQAFRDKYRSIDVLLMDDVQFLAGKERTQEEFFHTFNALHNDQKQIVISSDCPPKEIPTLQERLHSRFEWGLIADIEQPDLETKIAILKRKADLDGVNLPDDIAFFIASKVKSNIRELEGSLVRLVAISSLRGLPISKMLAQDALRTIISSDSDEALTIDKIAKTVAAKYKLSIEELKSKNNARQIAVPRQIAMYLCKRLTKHSFPEIGREFGGKHHTTVMHSVEKIDSLIKEDSDFHKIVSEFIDGLCG